MVGAPCLVRNQPSAASCAYASTTVPLATPSWEARVLVDGTVAPGASRPARIAARRADSIERRPSTGPDYSSFDWSSQVVQSARLSLIFWAMAWALFFFFFFFFFFFLQEFLITRLLPFPVAHSPASVFTS